MQFQKELIAQSLRHIHTEECIKGLFYLSF